MKEVWKVYFSASFGQRRKWEHPGREIRIDQDFCWGDKLWRILSVYRCAQGLVMDLGMRTEAEEHQSFIEKWYTRDALPSFTEEEYERIEAENPVIVNFRPRILLNGKHLEWKQSSSVCWSPVLRESASDRDIEERLMKHYRCDRKYCWTFTRAVFPWTTKTKPSIRGFKLTLEEAARPVPGAHFTVTGAGERIVLRHPVYDREHTLSVVEYRQSELKEKDFPGWPRYYKEMYYHLEPDIPDQNVSVLDCARSDLPMAEPPENAGAIGIIGGEDGPTALYVVPQEQKRGHIAVSALHYQPEPVKEWRIVFREKLREDITVEVSLEERSDE